MVSQSVDELAAKHCVPCEGGVRPYATGEAADQLQTLAGWRLTHEGKRIRKDWVMKNFVAAMEFFQHVAGLAESEQHHPDVHLEGYRHAWIEIWTHAIGGLSENDFILAAKIDQVPVQVKNSTG
ncbi:MAG: 4a-hydroxytetrahydrobiopterin dehydratase [Pirellulales bacterium]|nr:4a-hydroxytetrahydrobiopterin dehydratase [Pirellulales bacterium]